MLKVLRDENTATNVNREKEGNPECPKNLLESPDVNQVNFWIPRFVAEVRNRK